MLPKRKQAFKKRHKKVSKKRVPFFVIKTHLDNDVIEYRDSSHTLVFLDAFFYLNYNEYFYRLK
jgi:hypothetical protein